MRASWLVLLGVVVAGCQHDVAPPASRGAPARPSPAVAPLRGASGDDDLRVMLSEIASSKACALMRSGFTGLRAADRPDVVTGVLWIRDCEISNAGSRLTFHMGGNGWLWVEQTKSKAGGSFTVHQYVRFSVSTTIVGALDIAYDRDAHVATVWFTPERPPAVEFKTVGGIDVDREGAWSSVVGALGTAFATSPDDLALSEAATQGTHDLSAQFADGLSVTINLCTGLRRVQLGRPAKGVMGAAGVGETRHVAVEVQPGGVIMIGPQIADDGMTLHAVAEQGGVHLALVCAKEAEVVAAALMEGRVTSPSASLGTVDVREPAKLRLEPTSCPVVVIASPLDNAPARFAWERPTSEIAHSTGGSMVHCPAKPAPVEKRR